MLLLVANVSHHAKAGCCPASLPYYCNTITVTVIAVTVVVVTQEESAALLSQMFAQQMAGNQAHLDPDVSRAFPSQPQPASVLFDSRAHPSQPPAGLYDSQDGAGGGGGGSEGGGTSRSSAPNPFETLTGLPVKAQRESGQSSLLCLMLCCVVLCHAVLRAVL